MGDGSEDGEQGTVCTLWFQAQEGSCLGVQSLGEHVSVTPAPDPQNKMGAGFWVLFSPCLSRAGTNWALSFCDDENFEWRAGSRVRPAFMSLGPLEISQGTSFLRP